MKEAPHILVAAALGSTLLGAPAHADDPIVHRIDVAGQTRVYALNRHETDGAKGPFPIVLFLPGTGTHLGDKIPLRYDLPFAKVPELGPALIVQAQGVNRQWDTIPGSIDTWRRLSGVDGTPVDDIGFVRTLVSDLVDHENGDPHRVYVAGVSGGVTWRPASPASSPASSPRWRR